MCVDFFCAKWGCTHALNEGVTRESYYLFSYTFLLFAYVDFVLFYKQKTALEMCTLMIVLDGLLQSSFHQIPVPLYLHFLSLFVSAYSLRLFFTSLRALEWRLLLLLFSLENWLDFRTDEVNHRVDGIVSGARLHFVSPADIIILFANISR